MIVAPIAASGEPTVEVSDREVVGVVVLVNHLAPVVVAQQPSRQLLGCLLSCLRRSVATTRRLVPCASRSAVAANEPDPPSAPFAGGAQGNALSMSGSLNWSSILSSASLLWRSSPNTPRELRLAAVADLDLALALEQRLEPRDVIGLVRCRLQDDQPRPRRGRTRA